MRSLIRTGLVAALLLAAGVAQAADTVTVFAAASLKNALDNAGKAFTSQTGVELRASYAASSALARQIESGAPADLFASADLDWMDYLAKTNLIRPDTRVNLLGNRLVLIAPSDAKESAVAFTPEAFAAALGPDGRLATGEVNSVPIGKYAKVAFEKLGLWGSIQPRLAQSDNVRAALMLVSRGEAPLGVVYESDAKSDPTVKVVGVFPADSHPPVVYPFAVTADARGAGAKRFLEYLRSPAAKPFFEAEGFRVIDGGKD
ncbi:MULTISPECIES: molybdate ABC transporter substrate-binding protein [Methylobacterium]|uniref:Molybdate ABC transporter substrate-binding protein n=1 Tax=Methylobacterium longum TaxID=767694 RepID=A0ABT8AWC3_9HYPH|nr:MULTISPECIES: molybdate ABC transporter substrate-binding protein [Methylobacterium]MCJ2101265.1 molybdate ABC transporter substrate-binding protein [Methylobacterium sp. E-046]MDN3573583.1 molybdate ABC transporter substrate-binding protein [Methylobacterium longum]GJE13320.1 Molybdate-binding protein ModA [Methylobacterium longum]